jgi:hypothetical protein
MDQYKSSPLVHTQTFDPPLIQDNDYMYISRGTLKNIALSMRNLFGAHEYMVHFRDIINGWIVFDVDRMFITGVLWFKIHNIKMILDRVATTPKMDKCSIVTTVKYSPTICTSDDDIIIWIPIVKECKRMMEIKLMEEDIFKNVLDNHQELLLRKFCRDGLGIPVWKMTRKLVRRKFK